MPNMDEIKVWLWRNLAYNYKSHRLIPCKVAEMTAMKTER